MNKALKMVLAAAGALVLGGIGEGLGSELLKKVAKNDDNTESTTDEVTATAEESNDVIDVEEPTDETED